MPGNFQQFMYIFMYIFIYKICRLPILSQGDSGWLTIIKNKTMWIKNISKLIQNPKHYGQLKDREGRGRMGAEVGSMVNRSTIFTVILPHWSPKLTGRIRSLGSSRKGPTSHQRLQSRAGTKAEKVLLLDPTIWNRADKICIFRNASNSNCISYQEWVMHFQ